jgi:hypothetical protein
MSRLQKKPPAHKKGHPTLQNMNFFYFLWVIFALLDPDPDPYSNYGSGSESNGPIEYGSNTDTDPDPKPWFFEDKGLALPSSKKYQIFFQLYIFSFLVI